MSDLLSPTARTSAAEAVEPDVHAAEDEPLYESRREIYQQSVKGRLRTIKWAVLFVCRKFNGD